MRRSYTLLFVLLILSEVLYSRSAVGDPSNVRCKDNVCFPSTLNLGDRSIPLIGLGTYPYYFFDVYTAGWYAPQRGIFPSKEDVPYVLTLHYFHTVKANEIIQAAEGLLKRQGIKLEPLAERINALNVHYVTVNDGDEYSLRYVPGRGTALLLNGVERVTIPGKDFADAYFGIWLHSEKPLSEKFRDALLGVK